MHFLGFLDGGFCETGALPEGASSLPGHYWRQSSHNPRLSLPFFGLFWLWLLWVIGAAAPILALLASLAFLPRSGRGFCFLAFAPVLAFCPFGLGCAARHGPPLAFFFAFWPLRRPWLFAFLFGAVQSGMALWWPFVCVATLGVRGFLSRCAALLVGGLVDGGASGDIQGCPFVQLEPH